MTSTTTSGPSTDELVEFLSPALAERFGVTIDRITRLPSRYSTSFAIEDLTLRLNDGSDLSAVFKNLSPEALLPDARRTRPDFVFRPEREIEVYRRLLAPAGLGTAALLAADVDPDEGRYWLFLEKVPGVELYQVEDLEVWKGAARWLRIMHDRFAGDHGLLPESVVRIDAGWHRRWMNRAVEFAGGMDARLQRLASVHEAVVDRLCSLPPTLIHGDFYASNVLTAQTPSGLRVCPVDWERAAVGPGLMDLASLTTGWDANAAAELARAYAGADEPDLQALSYCRLQLGIQWLGWSTHWLPPEEHRQDWLGEAVTLAEELGL